MKAGLIGMLGAAALESVALWELGGLDPDAARQRSFIGLHLLASLTAAFAIPHGVPAAYGPVGWPGRLFFFLISLCVPLFGLLGMIICLLPALRCQRTPLLPRECSHSQPFELRGMPDKVKKARTATGGGRLMGLLQHGTDRTSRLHALIATLSLDEKHAVPLLRIGLKDRDDDVRLLAYSLMTRKEKALEASIGQSLGRLATINADRRHQIQRSLAQDFWELAGLGNNDSTVAFLLHQARMHAQGALELQACDAGLHLLFGRILLRLGQFGGAHTAFSQALAHGVSPRKVFPFLAETAFYQRQFTDIVSYMNKQEFAAARFPLNELAVYWDRAGHEA